MRSGDRRECRLFMVLLAWIGVMAALEPVWAVAPNLDLVPGTDRYDLAQHVALRVDPEGVLDIDAVLADDGAFQPWVSGTLTFGFNSATHWFRGRLSNRGHDESRWVMLISYTLLDEVDLYLVGPGGQVSHRHGGDRVPFAARGLDHRHFNFLLRVDPGTSVEYVVRVRSESSLQVPLEVKSLSAFANDTYTAQLGLGLVYGVLLALTLYNFVLFVSVRDVNYLYYVLYVICFAGLQLALNGIAFQYFWPESPDWANTAILVFMALAMMSMLQFCRHFLELRRIAPRIDLAFRGMIVFLIGTGLLAFWAPYGPVIRTQTGFVVLAAPTIFVAGVVSLRKGYRPARHFLVAWTVLLVGILAYSLVSFGLLPKVFVTEYGIQIGSSAEMILLSFALAYRINVLTEENARIAGEARSMLEERVTERTRELNQALDQLEAANQVLRESSERDGLTGAHNRRHLENVLDRHWARAIDREAAISLIVLDLDHFKQVNDEHGHLAGDDTLKTVARLLMDNVAHGSTELARFGGEEFVIVLPGWDLADAQALAEQLRQAVAERRIESEDQVFSVTASFGVACMSPKPQDDCRDLIRAADRAMYTAKRRGRNRVVAASAA